MIDKVIHKFKTAAKMPIRDAICLIYKRIVHKERWSRFLVVVRQTFYFCPPFKKRLVVYLIPGHVKVGGGLMSIYNQASYARGYLGDAAVILSTVPSSSTIWARNKNFPNEERVWRWEMVSRILPRFDDVLIHLPEYYVKDFYEVLSRRDVERLHHVARLSINIMNQMIDFMPDPKYVDRLRELTPILSQTCAHTRYSSQEKANYFRLATIFLPAYWRMDCYKSYSFDQKVRRICYSPDQHPRRDAIVKMLKRDFPDFDICEIHDLTFPQFMDFVARSYFVITFGEGLDGYYSIPLNKGTMTFSVYNDRFFTKNIEWGNVWNVFENYNDMSNNLSAKIRLCMADETSYAAQLVRVKESIKGVLTSYRELESAFQRQFARFYSGDFDCYPQC